MIKPTKREFPRVHIRNTEIRPLLSKAVKDMEYQIYVAFPEDYASSKETYPTVYLLDAWSEIGILKETYELLRLFNEIQPLLLVGIAFKGDVHDLIFNRSRDYTPTLVPKERLGQTSDVTPTSGGGPNFLCFIETELIPMIESEYRADKNDRSLFGTSYGGLFAIYTLFCHPGLFHRYFLGNPSVWWDNEIAFKYEEEYARENDSLPAKIFYAYGSEEDKGFNEQRKRFLDQIMSRNYKGLELSSVVFDGETHMSVIPAAISRALRVLFR